MKTYRVTWKETYRVTLNEIYLCSREVEAESDADALEKVQSEEMNGTETPYQKEFCGYECWETNEAEEG